MSGRKGENICTFHRAFNLRQVDPWIVRAVYEEVLNFIRTGKLKCALRASDRLLEDLQIDLEDVEEIGISIAARAGYDLTNYEQNPFYAKLKTVGDLVMFFTHQRRLRA